MHRWIAGFVAVAAITTPVTAQQRQQQQRQPSSISASDRQQGAAAHPELVAQFGGVFTGPQAAYVERVGKRVAVQSGLSNSSTDFVVTTLDSPVENAFAVAGGYVYVTRQLLGLMNSEAELASVLGHEVGHVAARHAASRNTRATIGSLLAAGAGQLTGSEAASRVLGVGAQLYTLRYGRAQEYEADSLGVRYITSAGYNPFAAASMLNALDSSTTLNAKASGTGSRSAPTWASSHPNGQDRVRRATQLAAATGRPSTTAAQDTTFLRMLDGLPYGPAADKTVLRIVQVQPRDTVATLSARMAVPQFQQERFRTLNGLEAGQAVVPGRLVKLVSAG